MCSLTWRLFWRQSAEGSSFEVRTAGVAMDSRATVSYSVLPPGDVIVRYPLPSFATSSTRYDADVRDLGRDGSRVIDVTTKRRRKASLCRVDESKSVFGRGADNVRFPTDDSRGRCGVNWIVSWFCRFPSRTLGCGHHMACRFRPSSAGYSKGCKTSRRIHRDVCQYQGWYGSWEALVFSMSCLTAASTAQSSL